MPVLLIIHHKIFWFNISMTSRCLKIIIKTKFARTNILYFILIFLWTMSSFHLCFCSSNIRSLWHITYTFFASWWSLCKHSYKGHIIVIDFRIKSEAKWFFKLPTATSQLYYKGTELYSLLTIQLVFRSMIRDKKGRGCRIPS